VVDDNSPDNTFHLVQETFQNDDRVIPILRTADRGLAKSIRAGIERASGDFVLVMDTDFTHDPAEIPKMLHIVKFYNIVSGSRFCAGGGMQDTKHYLLSLTYNWLLRIILLTQVQDNLGGFFVMTRADILRLPLDSIFYGYGEYFFRLIHYAQQQKLSIIEIPTNYNTRKYGVSKSNFFKMLLKYTEALIKIKTEMISKK
jgi:dolichol-phosphate mannosyltransferase